jgi:hypothetical protein
MNKFFNIQENFGNNENKVSQLAAAPMAAEKAKEGFEEKNSNLDRILRTGEVLRENLMKRFGGKDVLIHPARG